MAICDAFGYIPTMLGVVLPACILLWSAADLLDAHQNGLPSPAMPCTSVEHVCGSLMLVPQSKPIPEGSYCACPACQQPKWDEADDRAFTWYHHEKVDWLIQYRFCEPIVPQQACRDMSEIAAVLRTNTDGWNPRIRKLNCRCPKNRYFMSGWHLDQGVHWDYYYTCERPACETNSSCVKHYLDRSYSQTAGYKFTCSCPEHLSCPTDEDPADELEVDDVDNTGPYVLGYCAKNTKDAKAIRAEKKRR